MNSLDTSSPAKPAIQIAGVIDEPEARMLVSAGVNYLGFPLRLPHGGEDQTEPEAASLIASVASSASCVVITYLSDAAEIDGLCRDTGVRVVQLHGPVEVAELSRLNAVNPQLAIIKSLIVRDDNLAELRKIVNETAPFVAAYITDTFDPSTGRSGATGKVHNWQLSRELVQLSPRPLILAGGLTADNVAQAISEVGPAGVDAHTGVEAPDGRKDPVLVRQFVARARAAFAGFVE